MKIQKTKLRKLQYLQENIAKDFTDKHRISGETYWTCIETLAFAKLAVLSGKVKVKVDF